jgi:hypothetical protein
MQLVVDPGAVWGPSEDGAHGGAVYDPTPVLDGNGGIHAIFSYCPSRYMARPPIPQAFQLWEVISLDDGVTWSAPRNLSMIEPPLRAHEPEWIVRTAGGGGNGVRISNGPHAGRLVVPGYHGYARASQHPRQGCTPAEGVAVADKWCNTNSGCVAVPGPLVALRGGNVQDPASQKWRCYSPSCLTADHQRYNATSKCIEYCTYDPEIAHIVETCQVPPPPSPYSGTSYSHVLLSDDDGKTWRLSMSFFPGTGEGSVAETGDADGTLLFVARRVTATHCVDPAVAHCAGSMISIDGGETWSDAVDIGSLPDPGCKNTVAAWPAAHSLVHGGSHSTASRTNVSALFSTDKGKTWGDEVMVWASPLVGGYTAAQTWGENVGIVFENRTCSIAIGILG